MTYSLYAVDFDGSNDYATAGDVLGFERTDSFSFALWVKSAPGNNGYFLGKRGDSPTYTGYNIGAVSSDYLFIAICHDNAVSDKIEMKTSGVDFSGRWIHLVWTYDGSSSASGITCYVNGSSVSLTTTLDGLTGSITNAADFWLGSAISAIPGRCKICRLNEVGVYDKELSSSEVAWIYNGAVPISLLDASAPSNLVGYWRMGDGDTYPTLSDSSGNGYDATMTSMASADIVEDNIGGSPGLHVVLGSGGTTVTTYYKMRARDDSVPPPGFVTWTVTSNPDFEGVSFSTGTPTPVGSMVAGSAVVVDTWEE